MNLARVEYYLSDFLSVIETRDRKENGDIETEPLVDVDYYKDKDVFIDFMKEKTAKPQLIYTNLEKARVSKKEEDEYVFIYSAGLPSYGYFAVFCTLSL